MPTSLSHVWSFDIGTSSFGLAVRSGNTFLDVRSLLIPDGFASIDAARTRRRMKRTREAHQAREEWLRRIFVKANLNDAVLTGRRARKVASPSNAPDKSGSVWTTDKGDYRLEREFPPLPGQRTKDGAPSDEAACGICYNSAALRIRLLQGHPLDPWQIFKALHSAIQKRGYDPRLPWKAQDRGKPRKPDDDEKVTLVRVNEAQKELHQLPEGCQFPCYLEAQLIGLWHPEDPSHIELRQTHHAESTRQRIFLRQTVEAELQALINAAVRQLPALAPHAADLPYGPAQSAYASYFPAKAKEFEVRTGTPLVRGKATDWQGVLSQKVPTFDNRALSSCALISRFHAAKCEPRRLGDGSLAPDSLLPAEVTFLMKLKNFRFALHGGGEGAFTVSQIREIFEDRGREVRQKQNAESYRLTKSQISKIVERCGGSGLLPNQTEIEAPRLSGRSRYSKPALKLVRRLVLSGESPNEFHARILTEMKGNINPLHLAPADLAFLHRIRSSGNTDATWENFYLPDESLSFVENAGVSAADKIRALIGRQNNPVVRHRLETFWRLLQELESKHRRPERIVLEFVREDFMGVKAKIELAKFQKERREARAEARREAGAGRDGLRYQLLKDQGGGCMYCEMPLGLAELPNCHLDHIVPDKMGGPGAYWNFALCCSGCNAAKGKRTPWQWFHEDHRDGWDAFTARVRARTFQLRNKKARLLTAEDAPVLVQRYQTLAETAWIARLAQMLVCLHFGWPRNFSGGPRQVVVLPGGLTARVRRKYGLNALLGQDIAALEKKLQTGGGDGSDAKMEEEILKKCRADKRHHALDAMVLSFLPQWTSDPAKQVRVHLPEGVNSSCFAKELATVEPMFLAIKNPVLRETIYASRRIKGTPMAASRFILQALGFGSQTPDGKLKDFCPKRLKKQSAEILDPMISRSVREFADGNPTADEWIHFARNLRSSPDGPLIRKIMRLSNKPQMANYKDMSKDGRGGWRTSKEGHRGQIVYFSVSSQIHVRAVMVFESVASALREVRSSPEFGELVGVFESLCCIELKTEVGHSSKKIPAGRYTLRTLQSDGRASFESAGGLKFDDVPLKKLLPAGFRRI